MAAGWMAAGQPGRCRLAGWLDVSHSAMLWACPYPYLRTPAPPIRNHLVPPNRSPEYAALKEERSQVGFCVVSGVCLRVQRIAAQCTACQTTVHARSRAHPALPFPSHAGTQNAALPLDCPPPSGVLHRRPPPRPPPLLDCCPRPPASARPGPAWQVLWRAVERIIPDIRQRAELSFVGTPLTHERFLRRHRGSYGPAIAAGTAMFPGGGGGGFWQRVPTDWLWRCMHLNEVVNASCNK